MPRGKYPLGYVNPLADCDLKEAVKSAREANRSVVQYLANDGKPTEKRWQTANYWRRSRDRYLSWARSLKDRQTGPVKYRVKDGVWWPL